MMKRREFITLLGGAAAWPLAARAQQSGTPVIGFLRSAPFIDVPHFVNAFRRGLKETDYVEGQNVAIEFRSADNQRDRLPALVADLLGRPVSVIVADNVAALAAKAATKTIPIVFAGGGDPVQEGLVASLNRPGGNVTGVNFFAGVLGPKRLELLLQLVPKATTIAVLVNPNTTETEAERRDVQAAAQAIGRQLIIFDVSSDRDIELAFATFAQRGAGALLTGSGGFLNSKRERLVALAARHRLPAAYAVREAVVAGGLMSYGPSVTDAYHQVGVYTGRILKGEKPADLPVMQSTKFEPRAQPQDCQGARSRSSADAARARRRGDRMKRREFITLLGGAAAAWPLTARAQPADRIARVGFFGADRSAPLPDTTYRAFIDELQIHGFKNGQNLIVDYRRIEQDLPALSADAAELVRSNVNVLVTQGTEPALQAALGATSTLPIVMMAANYDPFGTSRHPTKPLLDENERIR
jgi:putative ABC transport system substrate-binding protein